MSFFRRRLMMSCSVAAMGATGAILLVQGESDALSIDFTDQSMYIVDTGTPANNYASQGIVSDGALVGPSGKLTYTSPSNKLCRQADGYYKYSAHNLCTYSEDFSNAAWADASMTNTASTLVLDATAAITTSALGLYTNAAVYTSHAVTTVSGGSYQYNIEVSAGSGLSHIQLRAGANVGMNPLLTYGGQNSGVIVRLSDGVVVDGHASVYTVTDLGDGYYRIGIKFTANATTSYVGIWCWNSSSIASAAGTEHYNVRKAHVYRYPANTDYIKTTTAVKYSLPYEYDTSGNCEGLLVEEQRTNLVPHSNTLNNATGGYTETGVSSSASSGSIFDGLSRHTLTASGSGAHALFRTVTLSAATTYTLSAILEPGAGVSAGIMIYDSTGSAGVIHKWNLSTEAPLTAETLGAGLTVVGTGITDLGGGKKRVWSTVTTSANTTYNIYIYVLQADGTRSYTASGEAIIGHHIQLEAGSFPTSPIITYGSTATRLKDNIYQLLSATPLPPLNVSGDVVSGFAEYLHKDLSAFGVIIGYSYPTTTTDSVHAYINASNVLGLQYQTTDAGNQEISVTGGGPTDGTAARVAFRIKEDDSAISYSVGTQDLDTTVDLMGNAMTKVQMGGDRNADSALNRHLRKVLLVPRAMSDAEVDAKGQV